MRYALVLVQIIGALGILAYPGVLVATVMSLAASGGGLLGLLWRGVLVVSLSTRKGPGASQEDGTTSGMISG